MFIETAMEFWSCQSAEFKYLALSIHSMQIRYLLALKFHCAASNENILVPKDLFSMQLLE